MIAFYTRTILAALLLALAPAAHAEPQQWTAVIFVQLQGRQDILIFPEPVPFHDLDTCDQGARMGLSHLVTRAPPGAFQLLYTACYMGNPSEFEGAIGVMPELPTIKKQPPAITIDADKLDNTG